MVLKYNLNGFETEIIALAEGSMVMLESNKCTELVNLGVDILENELILKRLPYVSYDICIADTKMV